MIKWKTCPKCKVPVDTSIYEEHVLLCNGNPHGSTCKNCDLDLGSDGEVCSRCGQDLNKAPEWDSALIVRGVRVLLIGTHEVIPRFRSQDLEKIDTEHLFYHDEKMIATAEVAILIKDGWCKILKSRLKGIDAGVMFALDDLGVWLRKHGVFGAES